MIELKNAAKRHSLAVPGYSLDSRDRADPPSTNYTIAYQAAGNQGAGDKSKI